VRERALERTVVDSLIAEVTEQTASTFVIQVPAHNPGNVPG
jgi:hypothetical protein